MRLRQVDEPLVIDPLDVEEENYATRQMRRRARRAEVKAARRRGQLVASQRTIAEPEAEASVEPAEADPTQAELFEAEPIAAEPVLPEAVETQAGEPETAEAELARIEPARIEFVEVEVAQVEPTPPIIAQITEPSQLAAAMAPETAPLPRKRALAKPRKGLLARMFGALVPRKQAKLERFPVDPMTEQLVVLRTEIALIQARLDRMISAATR